MSTSKVGWRLENSYARLPETLFSRVAPTPVRAPRVAMLNHGLAAELGLDLHALPEAEAAAIFGGNALPAGAEPIAQAYAGHQFGHFTMLGDGRALLLGEQLAPDGRRVDLQLKGSGPTPFSRRGDGRAALGPMLREYIISEAMHALGVPTTRSLAVVSTGEAVRREVPLPGAVLARVASSHIRVGTFEYLALRRDEAALRALVSYTLRRHHPDADPDADGAMTLLERTMERQASLVARWMLVGFIHGVMNTDNMTLSGETIDYGPCAFMDHYDAATVFSSIDQNGRYAYGNQPRIAHWNLARLAEALLPLLAQGEQEAVSRAEAALGRYPALFNAAWLGGMRRKLGLLDAEDGDEALARGLIEWMQRGGADYTNTLRALSSQAAPAEGPRADASDAADGSLGPWLEAWRARRARQAAPEAEQLAAMGASNPDVIPRNHQVERALAAAGEGDLTLVQRLVAALARPYEDAPEHGPYRSPPAPQERVQATFCGT